MRAVNPADTSLVDQVCQAADDANGKLKGRRLADAVDALNALRGTWELVPAPTPAAA